MMRIKKIAMAIALGHLLSGNAALATSEKTDTQRGKTNLSSDAFCFDLAGEYYRINPVILRAVSKHESGDDPSMLHFNKDGSYDVGLMGINSCHASELGAQRWAAMRDPCTNIMTGAWILRRCFDVYGYNWRGLGCYNSRTVPLGDKYARAIYAVLLKELAREKQKKVK